MDKEPGKACAHQPEQDSFGGQGPDEAGLRAKEAMFRPLRLLFFLRLVLLPLNFVASLSQENGFLLAAAACGFLSVPALVRLGRRDSRYRLAAVLTLGASALQLALPRVRTLPVWPLILPAVSFGLACAAAWSEYDAHCGVLSALGGHRLAAGWHTLRTYRFILALAAFNGTAGRFFPSFLPARNELGTLLFSLSDSVGRRLLNLLPFAEAVFSVGVLIVLYRTVCFLEPDTSDAAPS